MNKFLNMAEKVVESGDAYLKKSGFQEFHLEAASLLQQAQFHKIFDYKEILIESLRENFVCRQNFSSLEFSDLPITIVRGDECFIDIYFWRRRPTVIHNHHFSGSFQCLSGFNVDSMYKFHPEKELSPIHSLGKLEHFRTKELRSGDIESIDPLDNFIHQNHHQADLSVNLCFRTNVFPKHNLSNFLISGLKFEKDSISMNRAQRLFKMMTIDDFRPEELDISTSDALTFLLNTHNTPSRHPRILALLDFLNAKIRSELDLNIGEMMDEHKRQMDEMESRYE